MRTGDKYKPKGKGQKKLALMFKKFLAFSLLVKEPEQPCGKLS